MMLYNLSEPVLQYTNDIEYRKSMRNLFCMISPRITEESSEVDDITRDEQDYDDSASSKMLDFVYEKTFEHTLFQELYDIAASKMISMDRSIGLAVLFSYDYMALFHRCLCSFFSSPETFDSTHDSYVSLKKKLV
jgi:hypothetical protein